MQSTSRARLGVSRKRMRKRWKMRTKRTGSFHYRTGISIRMVLNRERSLHRPCLMAGLVPGIHHTIQTKTRKTSLLSIYQHISRKIWGPNGDTTCMNTPRMKCRVVIIHDITRVAVPQHRLPQHSTMRGTTRIYPPCHNHHRTQSRIRTTCIMHTSRSI